jgi:hypothetical protein
MSMPVIGDRIAVWPSPDLPPGARIEEFPLSKRWIRPGQIVTWSPHLEVRHRDGSLLLHDPAPPARKPEEK